MLRNWFLWNVNAGLESQRLAGQLEHLGVEANPVLVKAPNPVSLFVTQQTYVSFQAWLTLLFPFVGCQWTPEYIAVFKVFMEQNFCTSHFDVYQKMITKAGVGCPKTENICPMLWVHCVMSVLDILVVYMWLFKHGFLVWWSDLQGLPRWCWVA